MPGRLQRLFGNIQYSSQIILQRHKKIRSLLRLRILGLTVCRGKLLLSEQHCG